MIYGYDKTFHKTGHVDVETDSEGNVVAVWYRCMLVPFEQHEVSPERVEEMKKAYEKSRVGNIRAIDIEDGGAIPDITHITAKRVAAMVDTVMDCQEKLGSLINELNSGDLR